MAAGDSVKMMVSYGGEIKRCPGSGKARYVGGENRIVKVGMSERLRELRARMAAFAGYSDVRIRYTLAGPAGDDLDTLRDVECEGDLWRLVTLLCCCSGVAARDGRVRAFLFRVDAPQRPSATPARMRQSASSPALPLVSTENDIAPSLTSTASGDSSSAAHDTGRGVQAAAASLPRAQSAGTLYTAGSSATASGEANHAVQADSRFEALAAIAAEQSATTAYTSSSSAALSSGAACATQADSGFEALEAVAAEQKGQLCPAPVFVVPVALHLAVFYLRLDVRNSKISQPRI